LVENKLTDKIKYKLKKKKKKIYKFQTAFLFKRSRKFVLQLFLQKKVKPIKERKNKYNKKFKEHEKESLAG